MTTSSKSLMTIFAHPDDETFGVGGVMARAASEGARVTVVCATRGEVGEISDPSLATPETLGAVREGELRAACHELGVEDVRFLGYRDSGMAGTPDNVDSRAFANADAEEVIGRLVAIVREVRPDVVITFEPTGFYFHPDHMAASRHATAAFERAGDPAYRPELGAAHRPARLYYTVLPKSAVREFAEQARKSGDLGPLRGLDLDSLGVPDDEVDAAVDVRPWFDRKYRALLRHATQVNERIRDQTPEERERLLGRETFVLVRGAKVPDARDDVLGGLA